MPKYLQEFENVFTARTMVGAPYTELAPKDGGKAVIINSRPHHEPTHYSLVIEVQHLRMLRSCDSTCP